MRTATYGYGASGTPDIIACVRGKFVAIEVKREGKKPTAQQARRIKEIEEKGGLATWGTAKKVRQFLSEIAE